MIILHSFSNEFVSCLLSYAFVRIMDTTKSKMKKTKTTKKIVPLACRSSLFKRRQCNVVKDIEKLTKSGTACRVGSTKNGLPCVALSPTKTKRVVVSRNITVKTRKSLPRRASIKARVAAAKYNMAGRKSEYKSFLRGEPDTGNETDLSSINPLYEFEDDESDGA